jgi:hypothetical protein
MTVVPSVSRSAIWPARGQAASGPAGDRSNGYRFTVCEKTAPWKKIGWWPTSAWGRPSADMSGTREELYRLALNAILAATTPDFAGTAVGPDCAGGMWTGSVQGSRA